MKEGKIGDATRLKHILDAIEEIETYTQGIDFATFEHHSMMLNASIRQLEIIGEASNRLTDDCRSKYPNIEWAQIIALRNLLIHAYFGVNPLIIWEIIQNNIPVFKSQIEKITTD